MILHVHKKEISYYTNVLSFIQDVYVYIKIMFGHFYKTVILSFRNSDIKNIFLKIRDIA